MNEEILLKRLKTYLNAIDKQIEECREELVKRVMSPSSSCCLTGEISAHQFDKRRLLTLFPELESKKT
ncbi:MAG: hypothetical protein H8E33_00530 [Candidatus Cloacimonetes bacterium]|nr:hypothetical protein [Candidatus Cloacimonadota bacterium]